jgi:type II secretory pathway pseudopilin PulG
MVSIVIISILSSVTLYAMASVQTLAQEQRTKAQLARIHDLLLTQLESYEGRVPRRTKVPASGLALNAQQLRVCALRETMRLEMPDRITDVLQFPLPSMPGQFATPTTPVSLQEPPALTRYFTNFVNSHVDWGGAGWTFQNQGAECLYMILSRVEVGESSALEFFNETEIGDTDGDGMPEILDGWQRPVRFVRWPVGLAFLNTPFVDSESLDPLDPGRVFSFLGTTAGRTGLSHLVVPLVVSAGRDGVLDLALTHPAQTDGSVPPLFYSNTPSSNSIPNDPWVALNDGTMIGSVGDNNGDGQDNSVDNIYSHIIETSLN